MRYFLFIILMFISAEASALSCMQLNFDKDFINKSEIIFEGTVTSKMDIKKTNKKIKTKDNKNIFLEHDIDRKDLYKVKINKIWKGLNNQRQIEIYMNAYWGDRLPIGKKMLIFAHTNKEGKYEIPLCGFYREVGNYMNEVGLLEKILNGGLKDFDKEKNPRGINGGDQECSNDNQCTIYKDICASCGCGYPINKKHLEKYREKSRLKCNNKPPMMMCKMYCMPNVTAKCLNNKCSF